MQLKLISFVTKHIIETITSDKEMTYYTYYISGTTVTTTLLRVTAQSHYIGTLYKLPSWVNKYLIQQINLSGFRSYFKVRQTKQNNGGAQCIVFYRFYWSCSSVIMSDATPLTPLAHKRHSIFKCKQHTCTLHDPWGPEKYIYTMM